MHALIQRWEETTDKFIQYTFIIYIYIDFSLEPDKIYHPRLMLKNLRVL